MHSVAPHAQQFLIAVLGTVFAARPSVVSRLATGDRLLLVPDPPGAEVPAVWVHAEGGDVAGHLPMQVAAWLSPWMLEGARCSATVATNGGSDVESWRRLMIEVCCTPPGDPRA